MVTVGKIALCLKLLLIYHWLHSSGTHRSRGQAAALVRLSRFERRLKCPGCTGGATWRSGAELDKRKYE